MRGVENRIKQLESALLTGRTGEDWVEIDYPEFDLRDAVRLDRLIETALTRANSTAEAAETTEIEAEGDLKAALVAADRDAVQDPWWRWKDAYTPEARFFIKRELYEQLPSLPEAQEWVNGSPLLRRVFPHAQR